MAAQLSESSGAGPHRLRLPDRTDGPLGALGEVERALASTVETGTNPGAGQDRWQGQLILDSGSWLLDGRQLEEIEQLLLSRGLSLIGVTATRPETRVAAAGLGLFQGVPVMAAAANHQPSGLEDGTVAASTTAGALRLHRGTLRAGDHLEVEGSILLLGDVNPGASIRASGHVLVWGRLRGTAHAGHTGDASARIIALQLRPLQLRIATAVARGPEGVPPDGLAEEAELIDGVIQIHPAAPGWPLSD